MHLLQVRNERRPAEPGQLLVEPLALEQRDPAVDLRPLLFKAQLEKTRAIRK
ncbi:hypothetical protein [Haliangium sp. UPWRP_2]|uniref:hypothetical protein n=1 Tax=Haliangium sp. UPWRP_2 TaxID=1931276 RepID=UPI001E588A1D|nr:hypothetical protein [Haliangium sp. UPWRP_2]